MDTKKEKFPCEHCGRSYSHRSSLKNHKKAKHAANPVKFEHLRPTNSNVEHRQGSANEAESYKCHICEKAFARNIDFRIHCATHTN